MIGSLVKIPWILVAMIGLHTGATSPNPPPSVNEKAPSTRLEVILKQRLGLLLLKVWNFNLLSSDAQITDVFNYRRYAGPLRYAKWRLFSQPEIQHLPYVSKSLAISCFLEAPIPYDRLLYSTSVHSWLPWVDI